jgi:orotate phosphoribosyltransferase
MSKVEDFKKRVLSEGILDGEDIHHEFVSGVHGRKLDFDKIETGSDLYKEWVEVLVDFIKDSYDQQPDVILGVANGANRLAVSVAAGLGNGTMGLMTEKETSKASKFHVCVEDVIRGYKPKFVLVIEDVGTAGTTSATASKKALEAGAQHVEVLNTWQRNEKLPRLDEVGVAYRSVILEPMPSYQPDECEYCKNDVEFVPHD